ncbi:D-alanyl-D-alanine carboxypeptidase [Herbiconiux sp. 11R-BC]|uniref:D-alanyl-D-alanine carboxypeptidase family protein n=1 Tax=Herbiconiux sp. 11R-BC TaxID=3111637 RepID=UPI003BFAE1C4
MNRAPSSPYRRRRIVVVSLLVLVALVGGYVPFALLAPLPAAVATVPDATPRTTPAVALTTPGTGASAIGIGGASTILGTSGSTGTLPIASITKTITALVVLDAKPIPDGQQGPELTMTAQDAQFLADTIAEGGSWASVYPGQVLSERQLLEIMMLESAGNYSLTLVTWAFGSVDAYLAAATTWIAAHGLSGTSVVDSTGLNPGSSSTTHDLLALGALVLADPVLAAIVGTATDQLPQLGQIDNTNTLIGMSGIDGIKTGTTDEAGRCLLFSADYVTGGRTVTLVGVVLGADSDASLHEAVLALLQSAQAGFQTVDVATPGTVVGSYLTEWGASADIVTAGAASSTVWSEATVSETNQVSALTTGTSGTEVGSAQFSVAGVTLDGATATVPLQLASALDGPDVWWRLTHPFR